MFYNLAEFRLPSAVDITVKMRRKRQKLEFLFFKIGIRPAFFVRISLILQKSDSYMFYNFAKLGYSPKWVS